MITRWSRFLLFIACVSSLAPAQQPAGPDDIARLMNTLRVRKQMDEMQRTMIAQMKPMFESMAKEQLKGITPEQRQELQGIIAEQMADVMQSYPAEEMIADMTPIYQKYLDKSDVEAMVAFYSSPTGQKYLDNQPRILQDFMTVMMPKMQERMQGSMERMRKRIREWAMKASQTKPADQEYKPATPAPPEAKPAAPPPK